MNSVYNALILQKKYENGELKVSNMTDVEYEKLEKLYTMQIYQLNKEIEIRQQKIEECKQDILKLK